MTNNKTNAKVGRPVNKDSDETRRAILDAAMVCFADAGYQATSNKSIAEMAGVTAGSIYHYFENKSRLFLAVYEEVRKELLDVLGNKMKDQPNLTSGWEDINEDMFDIHTQKRSLAKFNAMARLEAHRNPELSEILDDKKWQQSFKELSELAVKAGEVEPNKEGQLSAVLEAISLGINQHAIEASEDDHKLCLQGFVDLFEGNLFSYKQ